MIEVHAMGKLVQHQIGKIVVIKTSATERKIQVPEREQLAHTRWLSLMEIRPT